MKKNLTSRPSRHLSPSLSHHLSPSSRRLSLNRETLRYLESGTELRNVRAGCWETIALPCDDQDDSMNGCVSGNLC